MVAFQLPLLYSMASDSLQAAVMALYARAKTAVRTS
jgi:hypothetical protein